MRFLVFCLLFLFQKQAICQANEWLPYRTETGKWSFVKASGEKMTAEFDTVGGFWGVPFSFVENQSKWGAINSEGDTIVPLQFDFLEHKAVSYQTAQYRTIVFHFILTGMNDGDQTLRGVYDERGQKMFDPIFEIINIRKSTISQPIIYTKRNCLNVDCPNGPSVIYKIDGTFLTKSLSSQEQLFEMDNTLFISKSRKDRWGLDEYGLINEFGDTIIPMNRDHINQGSDRFPIVVIGRDHFTSSYVTPINGKSRVIYEATAPDGSTIYRREKDFSDKNSIGIHFVNADGEYISESESMYLKPTDLGKGQGALLKTNEGTIILDSLGNVLHKYPHYHLVYNHSYRRLYIDFQDSNGRWGLMDIKGTVLLPSVFDNSLYNTWRYHSSDDTITSTIAGSNVSIDLKSWRIIEFGEFKTLSFFKIGIGMVPFNYFISTWENKNGLLSTDGEVVIPHQWDKISPSYSKKRNEITFIGISKKKLAIYSINGELLKQFNWKRGTYSQIKDDYYVKHTKRRQLLVNSYTGETLFTIRKVINRDLANELFDNYNLATDLEFASEEPFILHYYDPKKGSTLLDSNGRILAQASVADLGFFHGIFHKGKLIGSLYHFLERTNSYSPQINLLNGVTLDSTYNLTGVNYRWYQDSTDFIEFYTREESHIVFFTPAGKFLAEYDETEYTDGANRILKNEQGVNIYSPNLKPLLPDYFESIKRKNGFYIGQRNNQKCLIYADETLTTSILYDSINVNAGYYLAYTGDTITLYDQTGKRVLDGCLTFKNYVKFCEAVTEDYIHWISNGAVYHISKR